MKLRIGALLFCSFGLLILGAQAQDAERAELPAAPSASKTQGQPQKAPPPAGQAPAPTPQTSAQQSQVPGGAAATTPVGQPASDVQSQPPKAGTASTSSSPLGPGPSEDDSLTTIRSTVNEVNVVF